MALSLKYISKLVLLIWYFLVTKLVTLIWIVYQPSKCRQNNKSGGYHLSAKSTRFPKRLQSKLLRLSQISRKTWSWTEHWSLVELSVCNCELWLGVSFMD